MDGSRQTGQLVGQVPERSDRHIPRAESLRRLGISCLESGRDVEAIAYLQEAARLAPGHAETHTYLGIALAGQGRLDEAESSFRRVVGMRPDDAGAHNHLGALLAAREAWGEAVSAYHEAIRLRPEFAPAHMNLAQALRSQGRAEEATASYCRALRLQPDSADAHYGMGRALMSLGRLAEAADHFHQAARLLPAATEIHVQLAAVLVAQGKQVEALEHALDALRLPPGSAATSFDLGTAFLKLRRFDEAVSCYRRALEHRPDDPDAWNNLGTALWELGRPDEAEAHYRRAICLRPDDPDLLNNLGNALWEQGQAEEAAACYRRGLMLRPDSPESLTNLGVFLSVLGATDEAVDCCRRAVALRPDWADAHYNLGTVLGQRGETDEAIACQERALEHQPDHAEAHRNRAMLWLSRGDFERGWSEYEWRWRCRGRRLPGFRQPLWEGEDLSGRTILLHSEQGLGDSLQFIRYAPLVKRRGGTVLLLCPTPLASLLARCPGVDRVLTTDRNDANVPDSYLPAFDVHAPLLSLPAIFGTTLADVPADVPYLFADPAGIERRRDSIGAVPGFRVGIAWQGNPRYRMDKQRSFPLPSLAPLARVPGVRLVSLQRGAGSEQLGELAGSFPVVEPDALTRDAPRDFLETAAILSHLDLVVTADTAIAHLSGGMGVRTWVALPHVAEWRWLAGREDSPWYPTSRLYRQTSPGDWDGIFRRMADALSQEVAARS